MRVHLSILTLTAESRRIKSNLNRPTWGMSAETTGRVRDVTLAKELALTLSDTKKAASELTLPEMLNDPIVQLLMASDGVTTQDVELLAINARSQFTSAKRSSFLLDARGEEEGSTHHP